MADWRGKKSGEYRNWKEECVYGSPRRLRSHFDGASSSADARRRASVSAMPSSYHSPRSKRKTDNLYRQSPPPAAENTHQQLHCRPNYAGKSGSRRKSFSHYEEDFKEPLQHCDSACRRTLRRYSDVSPVDEKLLQETFCAPQFTGQVTGEANDGRPLGHRVPMGYQERLGEECGHYGGLGDVCSTSQRCESDWEARPPNRIRDGSGQSYRRPQHGRQADMVRAKAAKAWTNSCESDERKSDFLLRGGLVLRYDSRENVYHAELSQENQDVDGRIENCFPGSLYDRRNQMGWHDQPFESTYQKVKEARRKSIYEKKKSKELSKNCLIEVRQPSHEDLQEEHGPFRDNEVITLITKTPEIEVVAAADDDFECSESKREVMAFHKQSQRRESNTKNPASSDNNTMQDQERRTSERKKSRIDEEERGKAKEDESTDVSSRVPELSTLKLLAHPSNSTFFFVSRPRPEETTQVKFGALPDALMSHITVKKAVPGNLSHNTSDDSESSSVTPENPGPPQETALHSSHHLSVCRPNSGDCGDSAEQDRLASPNFDEFNFSPLSANSPVVPPILVLPELDSVTDSLSFTKIRDFTSNWLTQAR